MTLKTRALGELDTLIKLGHSACNTGRDESGYAPPSEESQLRAFRTTALATVSRIAGRDSEFYRSIPPVPDNRALTYPSSAHLIEAALGAVLALRAAVEAGQLETLAQRVRSNTYDDFLVQAEELLRAKPSYHVAAMVLVGGVLEDNLSKMCQSRGIQWKGRDGLTAYNDALKETVYAQAVWRRIQVVADNRNAAAHGGEDASALKHEDVEDDLRWVRKFLAEDAV